MEAIVDVDYLVVGAGAMGMAFTDALTSTDPDVSVAIVDRRHGAGGHWLDAYGFVRLHQASAFYGVASTLLGGGRLQADGPERGLHERASAAEVSEYYARVLARPRFLRGEDELGYLLRALRNALVSRRRAESRRPQTTELVEEPAAVRSDDDPVEAVESRQVYAAIQELPEEFRETLVAVDIVGLSYGEAARALGVPEGTVTSRLARARDRVASRLEAGQ